MTARMHIDQVRGRARAAFLGVALGDALGATVEFMTAGEIRAQYGVHRDLRGGGWLHLAPGDVTDDTEMSLALAEAIVSRGRFEARAAAEALAAWMRSRPTDVGNTVRRGLRRYLLEGTLEAPPAQYDAGNGAAMRMVPVALATLGDRAQLAREAVAQARITHHHPLSDLACVHVGQLVQLGCLATPPGALRRASDALVTAHPNLAFEAWRGPPSGYVLDTLRTVLRWVHASRSFEECLVGVVNEGGDADTTGAIAGGIAGALYGAEALPARWLRRLDRRLVARIQALADRLVELSPLAQAARVTPGSA
ncbi:MAG TPA: ADP-ribosyl-[dinitrogen reductase] hydrolase [Anaeromyxobacteraceae bacterium]|nr:ADP-ribosyl-[dinitrogen reductase] hydrolase [Anaeromyxobacteraceae bacterium]